jgi:predicted CXXCH cytochrome family protein
VRFRPVSAPIVSRADAGLLTRRSIFVGLATAAVAIFMGGMAWQFLAHGNLSVPRSGTDAVAAGAFVGSEACAGCHQTEARLWDASQHKRAMDHATEKSVLGDFSGVRFTYFDVQSRFFRDGSKYLVETDGPDGKLATFEVKYTYGVDPLQQYLIEFPDGRLQALSIAWDTRPKDQGGQRWFHLYPGENIRSDDELHWTKLNQNWNFMCSECHSTGVAKNYDATHDRFATTWAEISVGCEACHGQGSTHVAWARDRAAWWKFAKADDPAKGLMVNFDERRGVAWSHDPQSARLKRSFAPATLRKEVETCGLCHARRGQLAEGWIPGRSLSETHLVTPISRALYFADGQIRDEEETYNYVPFKQSPMFAAGVTCSDCHEPHSGRLRRSGDNLCLGCHAETLAEPAHHHHDASKPAPACISCHMSERTYMVVDRRHDHSFRIPRPDISAKLGTPNACNDCHADKSADWAASMVAQWGGTGHGFQNYAAALDAAWADKPDSTALLAGVIRDEEVPAVARASALSELAVHLSLTNLELARAGLRDPDPMVRIGALDMFENAPATLTRTMAAPLLADQVRGVRIRAAALLAPVGSADLTPSDRDRFERAAAEFVAAQSLNADRPEARAALGTFYAKRRFAGDAEPEYRAALRLDPRYAPAAINLADLFRQTGRDGEGSEVLRAAIEVSPQDAGLHHALGLALVRAKRSGEALAELRRAAELDPAQARYGYIYAIALNSAGRRQDALDALKDNLARHLADRDTLLALVSLNRDAGDQVSALDYAQRLARVAPDDRSIAGLIDELRRQIAPAAP